MQATTAPASAPPILSARAAPPLVAQPAATKMDALPPTDRSNGPSAAAKTSASALMDALPPESKPGPRSGGWLMHGLPMALLGCLLLGVVVTDAFSDKKKKVALIDEEPQEEIHSTRAAEVKFKVAIEDEPEDLPVLPVARFKIEDEPEVQFLKLPPPPVKVEIKDEPDENPQPNAQAPIASAALVNYVCSNPPSRFGMHCTEAAGTARSKLLTYSNQGDTNTTVVKVNGKTTEFGSFSGKWTRKQQPLAGITPSAGAVRPSQSTWSVDGIAFHQVLEVVPGQPVTTGGVSRRQLDSVLVRWVLQNDARVPRPAGLRLQLDTLIGSNDGVPFTVPGFTGLVSTFADFRQAKDVPDFIQALEYPNLKNPGTVAHMTLKVGGHIEPPARVSLTHWPGTSLAWEIPIMHQGRDSAVVLYWPEKVLQPGEKRTIGFAYGLGSVSSNDKLGVTLGGSFEPGQNFTVSAYVENPLAGQTVRLELPDGLRRVDGAETQNVALGNDSSRNTSIVTWKVLVERTGEFRLKVLSSTGLSQAKTISIAQGAAPTGGKLQLELQGSFEPGQKFSVQARVQEPLDNQTLTLQVPAGLEKTEGELTQRVPAPLAGSKESQVTWTIRVKEAGKYPLRVSSSSGIAQTKTITIVQPNRAEGNFQILLKGDFAPGQAFTVSTRVVNPAPDQKLTLVLPQGLERVEGADTQEVKASVPLTWKVKIQAAGKYTVGVKSTTGVTQRKTLLIESPGSTAGGRFHFDLIGDIGPGKEFIVTSQVTRPLPGQTLSLHLPAGLQLVGSENVKTVPPPAKAEGMATVSWTVRVLESGSLRVRVESSTGVTRAKTINLTETSSTLFGR